MTGAERGPLAIEFDSDVDPVHGLYSRSHISEVLPDILGPLAWTILGEALERSQRVAFRRHLGVVRADLGDLPFFGRFGGYVYRNLSVLRLMAERLPGTSPTAIDAHMAASTCPDLPTRPGQRRGLDAVWRIAAAPTLTWTVLRLDLRVREAVAAAERSGLHARHVSDQRRALVEILAVHHTTRAIALGLVDLVSRRVVALGGEPSLVPRALTGMPSLQSTGPAKELAGLARLARRDGSIGRDLLAGMTLDDLRSAARTTPSVGAFVVAFEDLAVRLGHRGANEFDPTVPTWEHAPEQLLALLVVLLQHDDAAPHLDRSGPRRAARRAIGALAGDRRAHQMALLLGATERALLRGERTKGAVLRVVHGIRRLLIEQRRRLASAVDHEHFPMLTLAELTTASQSSQVPDPHTLERRRLEIASASAVEVPYVFHERFAVAAPWAGSVDGTLVGVPAYPGTVRGRAWVAHDPGSLAAAAEPMILVARVTDSAWTPLFPLAAAIVVESGGTLSHAAIVARDLGIPTVVEARGATSLIRTGDEIEVDGGTGRVRLIRRATSTRDEVQVHADSITAV